LSKIAPQICCPRHLVEYCFSKLKQFRRVAACFEKTNRNYRAVVTPAAHHLMDAISVQTNYDRTALAIAAANCLRQRIKATTTGRMQRIFARGVRERDSNPLVDSSISASSEGRMIGIGTVRYF